MPLKFTLQSIFTFMVIVALIVSVAINLNRERTITVMSYNYADAWQLLDSARDAPQWLDKSLPPPIGPERAYAVCLNVTEQLEASHEALGLFDWKIESISLVPLGLEHNWAYVCSIYGREFPGHLGVNNSLSVQILIQMDGSVIFDPAQYPSSISDVMNGIAGIQFCPKPDARKLPDFDTLMKQIDDMLFSKEESPTAGMNISNTAGKRPFLTSTAWCECVCVAFFVVAGKLADAVHTSLIADYTLTSSLPSMGFSV